MSNRLVAYFNQQSLKRAERKIFNAKVSTLVEAIKQQDAAKVVSLFSEVKSAPQFDVSTETHLLKAAIRRDNVEVFSTILNGAKSPDIFFVKSVNAVHAEGCLVTDQEHILAAAISAGSRKVALSLARNKAVSVDIAGAVSVSQGRTVKAHAQAYDVTPLEMARKKGMNEVADVIAVRLKSRPKQAPKHG